MSDTERAVWLAERRRGVGASDVAGILGLSPWASPYSVWFDKVFGLDDDGESLAMSFGRRAEAMIAPWFTELTELHVGGEQMSCEHSEHPWRRCTIDGLVFETPKHEGGEFLAAMGAFDRDDALGALEVKTTSATPKEWEDDGIPVHYQCQAQWTMHVTGTDHLWFAVLHLAFGRPDLRVYELARDQTDIDLIVKAVDAFWTDHVLANVPPETDAHQATTYATKHLPASVGDMIEITDDEIAACIDHLREAKAEVKQWELAVTEYENAIRAALGECTEGYHGGQLVVSYRPQSRKGIDTKALQADLPEVAAKYQTETTHRVLRMHAKKEKT